MKYLLIIAVLLSCHKSDYSGKMDTGSAKTDTIRVIQYKTDTLTLHDTIYLKDKRLTDSLRTRLFIANYKIERVRYYLKICLRNPSQTKFLNGWIKRAIE